jgi:hypothetical protein
VRGHGRQIDGLVLLGGAGLEEGLVCEHNKLLSSAGDSDTSNELAVKNVSHFDIGSSRM